MFYWSRYMHELTRNGSLKRELAVKDKLIEALRCECQMANEVITYPYRSTDFSLERPYRESRAKRLEIEKEMRNE